MEDGALDQSNHRDRDFRVVEMNDPFKDVELTTGLENQTIRDRSRWRLSRRIKKSPVALGEQTTSIDHKTNNLPMTTSLSEKSLGRVCKSV